MTDPNEVTITVSPEGIEFGGSDVRAERSSGDLVVTTGGGTVNITNVSEDNVADAHHSKTSSASELSDVSPDSDSDAHHTAPTAGTGLTDEGTNQLGVDVVASGSETLSSGAATVDTGVATSETGTFMVAFGPSTNDADVAADIRADSGSGTYQVDIQETDTSVGNPTVEYDIVRVR